MANKITVTSAGTVVNANVTPDTAMYYSDKSKEWAISDKIVDNTDYSSKYYANESKKQADISTAKTTEVVESGNTAVSNIENARDNAIIDITNQENVSVDNVNTAGATQIGLVKQEGAARIEEILETGCIDVEYTEETSTLSFTGGGSVLLSNYYTKEETNELIPTNNNQLINGAGYAKKEEIPTLVSELENDSNFATQTQVMQAIASIPQFKLSIVNELPMTGEKMTLYLIPKEGANNDIYNEYVWIEQTGSFEFLGSTAVDLSDYYTKEETNGLIPDITPLATKQELQEGLDTKQDKGNYALKSEIPTKTSQLINDNDFINSDYITSMGENLIVNGTGILQNNYNFDLLTFDPTDGVESSGCFKLISSKPMSIQTTNFMPFDSSQSYSLSYYVKNSETTKTYDFIAFYDMDRFIIMGRQCHYVENTLMELTQPLKKGDTVIHVDDASKIVTTLTSNTNKGFNFWNYKSKSGFDYGIETYTRWNYINLFSYENIDTTNNTITLNSAWAGEEFEIGHKLSQCAESGGGTYYYGNANYFPEAGKWEYKTFTFKKEKYFKGTSYIKVGWLVNYSPIENNEFKISNITLSSKQDIIPDLETIRAGASKGATALQSVPPEYVTETELNDVIGDIESLLSKV